MSSDGLLRARAFFCNGLVQIIGSIWYKSIFKLERVGTVKYRIFWYGSIIYLVRFDTF